MDDVPPVFIGISGLAQKIQQILLSRGFGSPDDFYELESKLSKCTEEQEPLLPASAERDKLLVHDVDPLAFNTVVYSRVETSPVLNQLPLPVQCVDDPTGLNAVIAVEGQTYSMPNQPPIVIQGEAGKEDFKLK